MKRKDYMKIGDLIPEYIQSMGIARGLVGNSVCTAFDQALDNRFTKYIINREFNNGKLYCTLSSSVARDSLSLYKTALKERINSIVGEEVVKEIVFR
jgi:adenylylsulfate kinase-like enzyme